MGPVTCGKDVSSLSKKCIINVIAVQRVLSRCQFAGDFQIELHFFKTEFLPLLLLS